MAVELPTVQPQTHPELPAEEIRRMSEEVRALAKERNAVILAHNYQVPARIALPRSGAGPETIAADTPLILNAGGRYSWPAHRSHAFYAHPVYSD